MDFSKTLKNDIKMLNKRLQRRRQQEIDKRNNKAKSVETYSRGMPERRLSNGNIPCYACGPLTRPRYI